MRSTSAKTVLPDRSIDATHFIHENLRAVSPAGLAHIRLYTAHPASGLHRLAGPEDGETPPPYWAYCWAGGIALARHVSDHPETVAGRRVLDLGAGGGIVAIAAALAGAAHVTASETDPRGVAALQINAVENAVRLTVAGDDLTGGPAPSSIDIVLVGDLFYDARLARRVIGFLVRCRAAGLDVLIGDPGRMHLPIERLHSVARYIVPDFGQGPSCTDRSAGVFSLRAVE